MTKIPKSEQTDATMIIRCNFSDIISKNNIQRKLGLISKTDDMGQTKKESI